MHTLKELTEENLRLKSEIIALHSHSTQSIPFAQSQSQQRQGTKQKQLLFLVTGSHQVLADTTCASSFSNLKGHNVEPTKGQRLSPATTSPDLSGQDVEHTLAGQRSLSATSPNLSGHVEQTPVGQSSSLATTFYLSLPLGCPLNPLD